MVPLVKVTIVCQFMHVIDIRIYVKPAPRTHISASIVINQLKGFDENCENVYFKQRSYWVFFLFHSAILPDKEGTEKRITAKKKVPDEGGLNRPYKLPLIVVTIIAAIVIISLIIVIVVLARSRSALARRQDSPRYSQPRKLYKITRQTCLWCLLIDMTKS